MILVISTSPMGNYKTVAARRAELILNQSKFNLIDNTLTSFSSHPSPSLTQIHHPDMSITNEVLIIDTSKSHSGHPFTFTASALNHFNIFYHWIMHSS
jgi:hypothetical protein